MSVAPDLTVALQGRFFRELPEMAVRWQAEPPADLRLLALNERLGAELGLDAAWLRSPDGMRFLVGDLVPSTAVPVAQAYSGHQFGGFVPRLGDGRALLLGELVADDGRLRDIHLKGSGPTPFARGGDGLAAVGPMLREYIISEAMHALGVPTTRSLAVLAVVSCIALVAVGATPLLTAWSSAIARVSERGWAFIKAGPLSALPLLLAGSSYIVLQVILRPRPLELLKRLMLGFAFLLWGVTQLMAASNLATELGNVVIALYVIDLGLMIHSDLERDGLARS